MPIEATCYYCRRADRINPEVCACTINPPSLEADLETLAAIDGRSTFLLNAAEISAIARRGPYHVKVLYPNWLMSILGLGRVHVDQNL